MLNEMRVGELSQASIARFKGLARQPVWGDYDPTDLYVSSKFGEVEPEERTGSRFELKWPNPI